MFYIPVQTAVISHSKDDPFLNSYIHLLITYKQVQMN